MTTQFVNSTLDRYTRASKQILIRHRLRKVLEAQSLTGIECVTASRLRKDQWVTVPGVGAAVKIGLKNAG